MSVVNRKTLLRCFLRLVAAVGGGYILPPFQRLSSELPALLRLWVPTWLRIRALGGARDLYGCRGDGAFSSLGRDVSLQVATEDVGGLGRRHGKVDVFGL